MASSEEGRLPPSFRPIVERRSPQRINLESDVSYDTTKALIWSCRNLPVSYTHLTLPTMELV